MTEETITELIHVAYDEEFDDIKVSFKKISLKDINIVPFIGFFLVHC